MARKGGSVPKGEQKHACRTEGQRQPRGFVGLRSKKRKEGEKERRR